MYQVKIAKSAERDLDNITSYIAEDNHYKALSFTQGLINNFIRKISTYPYAGRKCKKFYYSVYKNYLIFYSIKEENKEVLIIHITHGARYTAYKDFI